MDFMKTRPIIDWHAIFILKNMTITWMFQFCVSLKEIPNRKCEQFQEMMDYFFNSWQPTLDWISSEPILFSDSLHFVRHFFIISFVNLVANFLFRWWKSNFSFLSVWESFIYCSPVNFCLIHLWLLPMMRKLKQSGKKGKHKCYRNPKGAQFSGYGLDAR